MQGIGKDNSSTHKFIAYDDLGQVSDGADYVTWVDADIADYLIDATRIGTTKGYFANNVTGASRWELWLWSGTLDETSYPVYDELSYTAPDNVGISQINTTTAQSHA